MSDKTPRTEREFHDIHIRHEVAHLLAFREAKCFSEKLESELAAANERAEAYKQVAEELGKTLWGCYTRLRIALGESIGEIIDIPEAPSRRDNIKAIGAALDKLEAINQLKKEIK